MLSNINNNNKHQMRKTKTFSLLSFILIFSSCQFSQSVNSDVITGAYSRGNGIECDDVVIEINGKVEKRNEFVFGEKINLIFNDINGLTNSENKTYPGLSMFIVKNEKDTILSDPNLLKNLDSGTDLSPLQLQANFVTALPYKNKEKYKVFVNIWDKKGDGKFTYELPFTITENKLLTIKNNGIEYSTIYLWNETLKQPVFDKNVNAKHLFILILEDIKGLKSSNGKVFPIFSIDITDNNGNKILSNSNIFSDFENIGVDPKDLKNQLTAKITFSEGKINNPCRLIAKLKDKNSSKEINITTELNLN